MRPVSRLARLGAPLLAFLAALAAGGAHAAPLTPVEIDRVVARTMQTFQVPGIAVGIVADGRLVFAKGYGVRHLGQPAPVGPRTQFAIGSISKSFTTAALALLVDEGKLHWDDRVIDVIPEFRLADPWVTREFTVRDLLTHRSGLGLGAGDLLFVTRTDFTSRDVLNTLPHLKPVSSFRSEFAYDNLLYVVAGEVVARVSGQSWENFVEQRLMAPLGMTGCVAAGDRVTGEDVADPHTVGEHGLAPVTRLDIPLANAAGGIQCHVEGMARWVEAQLGRGAAPGAPRVWSEARAAEMWRPQTVLDAGGPLATAMRTHFRAYGLAWNLDDFDGLLRVSHNGGLPGMVTHVGLLPERNVGVIVLSNQQNGFALAAISLAILDSYAGEPRRDWVALVAKARDARVAADKASDAAGSAATATAVPVTGDEAAALVGHYADAWRGPATIARRGDGVELRFSHTDQLVGPLLRVGPDLYVVRWDDRELNADAYVRLTRDFDGRVAGFTMRAVSATTDFSFDFRDLEFLRHE